VGRLRENTTWYEKSLSARLCPWQFRKKGGSLNQARDVLKKAGARVNGLRVRIPSYVVRRSLALAPRCFTLYARDGSLKHNIHILI
jgi:hypothetical protein